MNQPPKANVFVEARYRKLSRDLPQTVFFCPDCKGHPRRRRKCERCEGFGKLTRDSVQELFGWVVAKAFQTRKHKFHGAGREDVDVRMLGTGRPFVFELCGPKNFDVDLAELESEVNRRNEGRLEIVGLHYSEKARVRVIKETHHAKEYEARVNSAEPVDAKVVEDLVGARFEVTQRTPERVAHRRADLDRKRWIEFLEIEHLGADEENGGELWRIRLRTQHGTYVKEVLSGENGKTDPSLTGLFGVPCRCLELDVLGILDEEGEAEVVVQTGPPPFGSGL
ncbi:MAG: tRNA pseudouridine synthase 10 [Planctomycetota bacterium]|jgi:tRNA pseudouridine synthase 10